VYQVRALRHGAKNKVGHWFADKSSHDRRLPDLGNFLTAASSLRKALQRPMYRDAANCGREVTLILVGNLHSLQAACVSTVL